MMKDSIVQIQALERLQPDPDQLYDVATAARLAGVSRRTVPIYWRYPL
jgi:hypothetical protein